MPQMTLTAQEIAHYDEQYAARVDRLLALEKALYRVPSSTVDDTTHFFPSDPANLTVHHFLGGHFTEAVAELDFVFGSCRYTREACYHFFGFYPGQPRPTLDQLDGQITLLQERLRARQGD